MSSVCDWSCCSGLGGGEWTEGTWERAVGQKVVRALRFFLLQPVKVEKARQGAPCICWTACTPECQLDLLVRVGSVCGREFEMKGILRVRRCLLKCVPKSSVASCGPASACERRDAGDAPSVLYAGTCRLFCSPSCAALAPCTIPKLSMSLARFCCAIWQAGRARCLAVWAPPCSCCRRARAEALLLHLVGPCDTQGVRLAVGAHACGGRHRQMRWSAGIGAQGRM